MEWWKKNWGLVFIFSLLTFMFIVGMILDPGGAPGGSFYDD